MAKQLAKIFNLDTLSVGDSERYCPFKIAIESKGGTITKFNVNMGLFNNVVPFNINYTFSVVNSRSYFIGVKGVSNLTDPSAFNSNSPSDLFERCEIVVSQDELQNTVDSKVPLYCYYVIGVFVSGVLYNLANCNNAYAVPKMVYFSTDTFSNPTVDQTLYWTWDVSN